MKYGFLAALLALSLVIVGCSDETDSVIDEESSQYILVPQDHMTIQAAVDAAARGDTIKVADGVYTGTGNCDIDFQGKHVVLISENGPLETIINVGGTVEVPHVGFFFSSLDESSTVIEGFTIRNGYASQGCGMNLKSASPTIRNCIFLNNTGTVSGGAIRCKGASPTFINCTFVGNSAPVGSAVMLIATSQPVFENCIITQSGGGEVVTCYDTYSYPTFSCSNIFDNVAGDWIGCLEDQADSDGNISADPMFCEPDVGDFSVYSDSPCAAEHNECSTTIGALGVGCGSN